MDKSYPQLKIHPLGGRTPPTPDQRSTNRYIGSAGCGTRQGVLLDQGTVVTGPSQLWSGVRTFPASVSVDVAMRVGGSA
jgi:hypothetical protein